VIVFSFIFPGFAWALLVLLVPIIIHLFFFQRYKKVYFSNLPLLKALKEEKAFKNKLKKKWILFSRIALFVSLVLAFMQPNFLDLNKEKQKQWVSIYIDNSMSMSVDDGSGSLMLKAKSLAKNKIKSLSPYASFSIFSNTFMDLPSVFVSGEDALSLIDRIDFTERSIESQAIYAQQLKDLKSKQGFKEIVWFSDFQYMPEVQDNKSINHLFYRLNDKVWANVYIDSVWTTPDYFLANQKLKVHARINSNIVDNRKVQMNISLNNELKAIKHLEIKSKIFFDTTELLFSENDWSELIFQLEDSPVQFDNDYRVSLQTSSAIKILCISESDVGKQTKALFSNYRFETRYVDANRLKLADFDGVQFCVLNGLERLGGVLLSGLEQYVKKGGDLLILPKDKMDLHSYQNFSSRIGISQYASLNKVDMGLSTPNLESKLLKHVFKDIPKNVVWPKIKKIYELVSSRSSSALDVLKLNNDKSVLHVFEKGNSNIYQMAVGLDSVYGNFGTNALWISILYNMAQQSASLKKWALNFDEEHQLSMQYFDFIKNVKALRVRSEDIEFYPNELKKNRRSYLDFSKDVQNKGFYHVFEGAACKAKLAFNSSKQESKLMDPNSTTSEYFKSIEELEKLGEQDLNLSSFENRGKEQLWKVCLIFALVFILLEIFLLKKLT
tara:strand:- start:1542 stop:3545 length:2004 start_codon:yes stop_codon:yes gene_type:complete